MGDISNLPGISVNTGVNVPAEEVLGAGEALYEDQKAFDDTLETGGEPNTSQSRTTRKAIKRSLDRFLKAPETNEASGSSELKVGDSRRSRPTQHATGRLAKTITRDGSIPDTGTPRAAGASREDSVPAQRRPRRNGHASPPSAYPDAASADRKQAYSVADGVLASGKARSWSAVEATAAGATLITGPQATPKRGLVGSSAYGIEGIVSGVDDNPGPDVAVFDMSGVATPPVNAELGQTSRPEDVRAPVTRAAELAEPIVDHILVSMPTSQAHGEVRISLKQTILDGSEVRIFHEEGELKVVFVAETESAQRFLTANRTQFQQTLGERLQDQRVQVEVETPDGGGASREENRGRSRQQYVPQDDSSVEE